MLSGILPCDTEICTLGPAPICLLTSSAHSWSSSSNLFPSRPLTSQPSHQPLPGHRTYFIFRTLLFPHREDDEMHHLKLCLYTGGLPPCFFKGTPEEAVVQLSSFSVHTCIESPSVTQTRAFSSSSGWLDRNPFWA